MLIFLCLILLPITLCQTSKINSALVRSHLEKLLQNGLFSEILLYLGEIELMHGSLVIDALTPSLYSYQGVAFYSTLKLNESEIAFKNAVFHCPHDSRAWINLGEIQLQTFKLETSLISLSIAYQLGDLSALPRILRAKGWGASWRDFELFSAEIEKLAAKCSVALHLCAIDSSGGLEYTDATGEQQRVLSSLTQNAKISSTVVESIYNASDWFKLFAEVGNHVKIQKRIKLGIISSDFGVHPVATLVRGMVQLIDKSKIELFCFALHPQLSWWGLNITEEAEHIVWLQDFDSLQAATLIASYGIDILIDLNGHTMHSGLPIMAHVPAPVQISFLGLPTTTSASFINYYIGDRVSLPPEHSDFFSESLILTPVCYIVNDFAQLQGDLVVNFQDPRDRAPLSTWQTTESFNLFQITVGMLFATLSNSQKMDPSIFNVWTNILKKFPYSKIIFVEYAGHEVYMKNLKIFARYLGVLDSSLIGVKQIPWLDHLYAKTNFDIILDTPAKNGHTTGLDGLWAGVPTLTFGAGMNMQSRAGESMASSLESVFGVAYSLKEYEDLIGVFSDQLSRNIQILGMKSGLKKLHIWRNFVHKQRLTSLLFNTTMWTKSFTVLMQATLELSLLNKNRTARNEEIYHIFSSVLENVAPSSLITSQSQSNLSRIFNTIVTESVIKNTSLLLPIPSDLFDGRLIMLNIGGVARADGWLNVNLQKNSYNLLNNDIDIHRDMSNLQDFPDRTVTAIYSSHTLEHNAFGDMSLQNTLKEWFRILRPGGLLLVSVPDLETLTRMYLDPMLINDRWFITKMIYGSQFDSLDYHKVGFDFNVLEFFLKEAQFCQIERVRSFNLPFGDTSDMMFKGYFISLNVIAHACGNGENDFEFIHNWSSYHQ